MSRRRTRAAAGAILSGLLLATMGATGVLADHGADHDADDGCELSVSPRSGPPGTEFIFTGSGYTPTVMTLTQGDGEPNTIDLDVGDADPFEITVIAREGDEGTWVAEAIVPDTECVGTASITVTLPPTSTLGEPAAAAPATDTGRTTLLVLMAGLGVLFLVSSRLMLGRVRRRI